MTVYKTLNDGFEIIEYNDDFAASTAYMWNESKEAWGGSLSTYTEEAVKNEIESFSATNVYLVVKNKEVLALAVLKPSVDNPETMYINLLNVRSDYHGFGLGKALILMCLERTLDLGYDYLDLHTWPGNTKAMPLYKKCGFMWSEHAEWTFLLNFMPHILKQPLFKSFFESYDWYKHSSREITQTFDGVSKDDFDIYTYEFEAEGKKLNLDYEQRGRKLCKLQTDTLELELKAPKGKLAFGFNYDFTVTAKSKTPTEIKLSGAKNQCITTTINESTSLNGETVFKGSFYIEAIENLPNPELIYPSAVVEIIVDGVPITLGLGIDIKLPIEVTLHKLNEFSTLDVPQTIFMDVKSNLLDSHNVRFNFPLIDIASFDVSNFDFEIAGKEKKQFKFIQTPKAFGHADMETEFIVTSSEQRTSFKRKIHFINRNLSSVFHFDDYGKHYIYAGILSIEVDLFNTARLINSLTGQEFELLFPKLGKPFTEEAKSLKPHVSVSLASDGITFKSTYDSRDFKGYRYTDIVTLTSSVLTRKLHIENVDSDLQALVIRTGIGSYNWGNRVVFKYDGEISENKGTLFLALEEIEDEKFEENWVYVESPEGNTGFFWDESYENKITWEGWGIQLLASTPQLKRGESYTTKESTIVINAVNNWQALRSIATSSYSNHTPIPIPPQELIINDKNPVGDIMERINTESISHRLLEDGLKYGSFIISDNRISNILMTESREWMETRYLLKSEGSVNTGKEGSAFVVSNGQITFKLDPAYFNGLFSIVGERKNERLLSKYPDHVPFSWSNPYFGGFATYLIGIKNMQLIKENITADFVTLKDNFENEWKGVKSRLHVKEVEKFKDVTLENYFLTIPGTSVIAHFYKVTNETNSFKSFEMYTTASLLYEDGAVKTVYLEDDYGHPYTLTPGGESEFGVSSNGFAEFKAVTSEKLYALFDDEDTGVSYSNETLNFDTEKEIKLAHGESFISRPAFMFITTEEIKKEMLGDFKGIYFDL